MAGNITADNSGNILVEFDYNNIIVVDPNRTIDPFGKIQERLVDHENLVMYANLEAELLPRTKLAVGGAPGDGANIISVAKINFLKPTKNNYLGTGYYDELTGENTTKFKGTNQMVEEATVPKDGTKPYFTNQPSNVKDVIDNGLLGITTINITTNSSFVPSVKIELEDVQGRALFQLGNNSPYAAFFNLPYPQFYLTLKGYYGQAVRYQLNLEKFNARFNSFSGNYQVSLEFRGYKFNVLNEIAMGHLLATPHMYGTRFDIKTNPIQSQQTTNNALSTGSDNIKQNDGLATTNSEGVAQIVTKKGYQKIVEVYSEYKSKGLIPPDFPELTLVQLMNKLQNFENNIVNSFTKVEVEPLTNIRTYKNFLKQYFEQIRGSSGSWFEKYLNPRPLILKNNDKVYVFKDNLDNATIENDALPNLQKIITDSNAALIGNPTLGSKGPSPIVVSIKFETICLSTLTNDQIDWIETTRQQLGVIQPTSAQTKSVTTQYEKLLTPQVEKTPENQLIPRKPKFFIFQGNGRFDQLISLIESEANKKLAEYELSISEKLLLKISDRATGIGFKPTVRNIIAVIMASAEGFIRLLDEVHTNAWAVKYDPVRKNAILNVSSSAPGSDTVDYVRISEEAYNQNTNLKFSEIPVYPWPQFFVETPEDKKGRFQLKYIADPTVVDLTQGYLYEKWPEVEFVEEYMVGITQKFDPPTEPPPLDNERYTNRININAIEFPNLGLAYTNKEEIKFFYEIWERQFVTAKYSNLIRANQNQINDLIKLNIETEVNNIIGAIGASSPFLAFKLKNYDLNAENYNSFLSNISNFGTGKAYQDFIRDFFVTPYLRNLTENSFGLLNALELGKIPQTSSKSDALQALITNASNQPLIIDTLPFTDTTWTSKNLSNGQSKRGTEVYNTNKTLKVFEPRKIISNFSDTFDFTTNRPVTNFSYLNNTNPMTTVSGYTSNQLGLSLFYVTRTPDNFVPTEGPCTYTIPAPQLPKTTTTSILNTPFFINSILNGVYNNRRNDPYPYVQAAYLFLNSLPIATLRETYKTKTNTVTTELDYIASCFKKFGAIHKLPYAWILKLGSNWHRYKRFKENGVDVIKSAWSEFNYLGNYSPILSSETQTYSFKYGKENEEISITLQTETSDQINMNVGFYPKVISDFNYFYTGYDLYATYTNEEIQKSINSGMKVFNFSQSNINGVIQNTKTLNLKTWSVVVPQLRVTDVSVCDVTDNTKGSVYYVIPSFGSVTNQSKFACITENTTVVDFTSNQSVYNGSVRTLWSAPNYGYFDSGQIVYPQPDSYINHIIPSSTTQNPVALLDVDDYSKIEEIFSVFEKRILDSFEQEFLNFCKPVTNASVPTETNQFLQSSVNLNSNFRNFQGFFTSLMSIDSQVENDTDTNYFQNAITNQYKVFTEGIRAFMEYDVVFKYGNPSNYKRRIWDSYLSYLQSPVVVDPISFEPYIPNSLPSSNGRTTLQQSKINNPQAWIALETEVGFSTIPNIVYSDTGSYITDFFIQNNIRFTQQNVILLAPIIKMWATQKLLNPNLTSTQFKTNLQNYLNNSTDLQDNFLNQVLIKVRNDLPPYQQLPERTIKSAIQGEQSKVENYEIFKALNDKWIAGADFTNKTLFEDILFLDRASRNIGETIILDIFDLKNMFSVNSLNQAMSVYTFISGILIKNNFTVMNLPSYVNFYNIQDVDGTTTPQPEGSLEFANNMWGTFLNVDYRNSGPKMVCFFVGKPSEYLDLPKGNFRFRDDAFDLRRASDNPLIENQKDKKDWAVSNKCVGFNVDIGIRNQNIFYSFSVSQDGGVATSEAINTQINMVNQATGRNTATQNVSLYNLYKNRSYKCNVVSLGNALIQPTMYFNLRHVPMFNGPYMITEVQHSIQPGTFQTSFTGIRQGIYDLPAIDNFLQSINQNLLTRLEELLKIEKDKTIIPATTTNKKIVEIPQKSDNKVDAPNSCVNNVSTQIYTDYVVTGATPTEQTAEIFATQLKTSIENPQDATLRVIIFLMSYVNSYVESGKNGEGKFVGYNNNFGNISLYYNWTPTINSGNFFLKNYCCISVKASSSITRSEPLVGFSDVQRYIKFMEARIRPNLDRILRLGLTKYYACFWPKNNITESDYENNINQFTTLKETFTKGLDLVNRLKLLPQSEVEVLKEKEKKEQEKSVPKPGVTPTPSPVVPLPGKTCPPPYINSISPLTGNTGTIIQIVGGNFDIVSGITINGTRVQMTEVTIYNKTTMRVSVPKVGQGNETVIGSIILESEFGNSPSNVANQQFTYDPSVLSNSTASPGSYQNNANAAASTPQVNTNPQSTGGVFLSPTYNTSVDGKVDIELLVDVDTSFPSGLIRQVVQMNISIYDNIISNNSITQKLVQEVNTSLSQFVNNNQFKITSNDINNLLKLNPIPPLDKNKINDSQTVKIQFIVTADANDKTLYPQPTTQSFNYNFM